MTLDEVITLLKFNNKHIADLKNDDLQQIAEWLEELKTIKEEIGTDEWIMEHDRLIRNSAIDDFANVLKENYDYLPQILSQESFGLYIDEYAEQLKAGVENE